MNCDSSDAIAVYTKQGRHQRDQSCLGQVYSVFGTATRVWSEQVGAGGFFCACNQPIRIHRGTQAKAFVALEEMSALCLGGGVVERAGLF